MKHNHQSNSEVSRRLGHGWPCPATASPALWHQILNTQIGNDGLQTHALLPLEFCKEVIYCSAVCYHCCCTQTTPWLSSCYRPDRGGTGSCQSLCALTTGEKPDSSASLSLSVSAVGSSPAAGSLFPCRSVRKRRKVLHDTEGTFCLYTSLSPTSATLWKCTGFLKTSITYCSHVLFSGSPGTTQLLSP